MTPPAKNRGRKAKIPISDQINIYRQHAKELLDTNNKILPATSQIFKTLSDKFALELKHSMTQKAIHIAVSKRSKEIFGLDFGQTENECEKLAESECDQDFNVLSTDSSGLTITINLNETDQFNFDFISVQGPFRNYKTLRPGWSDKLFSIFVRETKSECCYSFKRVDIIDTEFKTKAICVECDGTIFVMSQQNRTKLTVQVTKGDKPHTFSKKRRLAKDKAVALINELKSDTTHNVYVNMVNELNDSLDKLPRDFPNEKALANLKSRNEAKRESAIIELRKMKYLPQYSGIKEICTDPFRLIFWTRDQIFTFFQLKNRQRVVLSFDATGGLVNRASIMQDISKFFEVTPEVSHIFLYLLCLKNDNGVSIPIGQMLSASQDSVTISFFLQKWIRDFGSPDEIVVDDSKALQRAIVLSCTRFRSACDYLNASFSVLEGRKEKLPECYIRLDITHYIKNLTKDKIFQKVDKRLKHFYLSILGVLLQCEDYAAIKKIVKDTLLIANYPIFGECNNVEVPSGAAFKNINTVIQTHDVSLPEHSEDSEQHEQIDEIEEENVSLLWFDDILNDIKQNLELNQLSKLEKMYSNPNWYFFPQINDFLRSQLERLPLWSPVMRQHYKSTHLTGISTDIESRFNILKNNVFRNIQLPVRADVFVKKFYAEVNGVSKLSRLLIPHIDENNNNILPSIESNGETNAVSENVNVSADIQVRKLCDEFLLLHQN